MNRDEKQANRGPEDRVNNKRPPKKKTGLFSRFSKDKSNVKTEEAWNLPIKPKNTVGSKPIARAQVNSQQRPNTSRPITQQNPLERPNSGGQRSPMSSENPRSKVAQGVNTQRPKRPAENQQKPRDQRSNTTKNNLQRSSAKNEENYKKLRVYKQEDLSEKINTSSNDRRKSFYFGLVGFIILLYFGSNIYRMFADSTVETMQISKITIDTPKIYDSLIVRDESVVNATQAGEVDYKIANNEKARVGDLVSTIIDENVEDSEYNLSSEEFTEMSKISNADVENINDRIKSEFSYGKINDYSKAYIYAEKIYESLEIRNQIIVSSMYASGNGTSVKSAAKESLYTLKSGIINYNIDSFEDVYTPEKIDDIALDDIKNATKTDETVRNKVVAVGESVFKIIESNTWYIVAYVDTSEIKTRGIEQDKNMEIYLSKANVFLPVRAKVFSIIEGDKTSKIVYQCDSYIGDFAEQRVVSIKLAKENVEGYKVPKTAILQKEAVAINKEFVFFNEAAGYEYVIKRGYDGEEYEVQIEKYNTKENVVYVLKETTDLNMGDMLINGDKQYQIPEIYKINGIYVLNTGIAVFKEVFPSEGALADTSLAFLEAKSNVNIRMSDTIAVNIEDVNENEIIY